MKLQVTTGLRTNFLFSVLNYHKKILHSNPRPPNQLLFGFLNSQSDWLRDIHLYPHIPFGTCGQVQAMYFKQKFNDNNSTFIEPKKTTNRIND